LKQEYINLKFQNSSNLRVIYYTERMVLLKYLKP